MGEEEETATRARRDSIAHLRRGSTVMALPTAPEGGKLCSIACLDAESTELAVEERVDMSNKDEMIGFIVAQTLAVKHKKKNLSKLCFVVNGISKAAWRQIYDAFAEAAKRANASQDWKMTPAEFQRVYETSPIIYVGYVFGFFGGLFGGISGAITGGGSALMGRSGYRKGMRTWLYILKTLYLSNGEVVRTDDGAKLLHCDKLQVTDQEDKESLKLDKYEPADETPFVAKIACA